MFSGHDHERRISETIRCWNGRFTVVAAAAFLFLMKPRLAADRFDTRGLFEGLLSVSL